MYRQKVWKRVAVLFAGPGMNFVVGLVLIYAIAIVWGLPNLNPDTRAVIGETCSVTPQLAKDQQPKCDGPGAGPAAEAGIRPGDVIVKVGDKDVQQLRGRRGRRAAARRGPPRWSWSATARR